MTTEEMIQWLDDHDDEYFAGERACIRTKLHAAEELAKKAEDFCMRRTVFTEQLGMALENYRKAGGSNE